MINNKKLLMIFSLFLVIGTVTALEVKKTDFTINTEPYQNLSISVVDPATETEVELYEGRARKWGNFSFSYYGTINEVELHASILDKEEGQSIKEEVFGPYNLGGATVFVDFYLNSPSIGGSNPEIEQELDLNVSQEAVEETVEESNASITGLVVDNSDSSFSKSYYYIGATLLGVLVLVLVLKHRLKLARNPREPNPKKIIDKKKPDKTEISPKETDVNSKTEDKENINDTEKRIADLQKQLEQIRSEEKLVKLQKQLDLEKESLKRMKESENTNNQNQVKNF